MSAPVPELAAWLLRTFGSGAGIETLLGDLSEEYHAGRSRLWFWHQALVAIVVTFFADEEQAMRRRLLFYVLVPTVACAVITTAVASVYLPTRYESAVAILIVPQRVPENFVRSTVTTKLEDRLQSLTQQIMSRTRLERIITDFNLYEAERQTQRMEDIVASMRRDIGMQVLDGDGFRISFRGDDPRKVMRVTERLASLYIEESMRDREVLAEGTTQFLEAQIEDMKRQIVAKEAELRTQRTAGAGPISEADLLQFEVLKDTYKTLLVKRLDARMAANLERRQIGEQFKLLDPARLPERALGPRPTMVAMAGASLGLGLGVIGLVVRRKKSFAQPGDPTLDAAAGSRSS